MLTRDEVVILLRHLGHPMTVSTWASMVSRHQAPQPDERIGRTPRWSEATIRDWAANRPGQGARTDLHKPADPAVTPEDLWKIVEANAR